MNYWTEDGRHPYFIRVEGVLAGFVLIREIGTAESMNYSVAEFFVMKKYRNQGVGQYVAFYLFNTFKGKWEVAQIDSNLPAQKFWRKTIGRYTNNNFQEIRKDEWEGPIQIFTTGIR
ncbi:GNAT family N-acetyltransferase [Cohnella soli]|uniref:GNAT family N-acetyltransferase n=1 Tax=Cohnella soli TaxID=425005 RepID=A0ABW0I138_9BACL